MSRGRKPDPKRAARKTGNTPQTGKRKTKITPIDSTPPLILQFASELPEGAPREMFLRATAELAGRLADTDLEALSMMAWSVCHYQEAQRSIAEDGMMVKTEWGPRVNPMLKVARDEAQLYLKIADQYGLTFVSRLRTGLMQLAGQSLMRDLHEGMAKAIVAQITDGRK